MTGGSGGCHKVGEGNMSMCRSAYRFWIPVAAILLAVLAPVQVLAQGGLEAIKDAGVLRAGIADERPYGYVDDQGRLTGEAPEISAARRSPSASPPMWLARPSL